MKPESLLRKLVTRGDDVSIEKGVLMLKPASGRPVPDSWLENHRDQLIVEIIRFTGMDILTYDSYSTGRYGQLRAGGVTIQFSRIGTQSTAYTIFNADLTRTRNTEHGAAGTALPDGHFRISSKFHLYKFLCTSGIPMPKRLSSLHDYMGNLKGILFSGNIVKGERLESNTIRPINLTCQQIKDVALNTKDNGRTLARQAPDNIQTTYPDKKIPESKPGLAFQPDSTTGGINYGISKQGSTDIRGNIIPITVKRKSVKDQSYAEWIADYESTDNFN